jgi:hypothetical protein
MNLCALVKECFLGPASLQIAVAAFFSMYCHAYPIVFVENWKIIWNLRQVYLTKVKNMFLHRRKPPTIS